MSEASGMEHDRVLGDAGNLTVYERPDGSRYALDKKGEGREWDPDGPVFGRARFDSRPLSSGRWSGSRSGPLEPTEDEPKRARRHRSG